MLFAALRRLSTLDNPQKLFDAVAGPGWPIWDQSASLNATRLASTGA